jgi:hypothetical protein
MGYVSSLKILNFTLLRLAIYDSQFSIFAFNILILKLHIKHLQKIDEKI